MESGFDAAAAFIEAADGLLIAAGAGMGVDSGLPDFRGNQGFWRAYPALAAARIAFEEIACPDAFRRTPALAWAMDMKVFFFVLLSWATPLPPAPPTRKLMPAVLNTA